MEYPPAAQEYTRAGGRRDPTWADAPPARPAVGPVGAYQRRSQWDTPDLGFPTGGGGALPNSHNYYAIWLDVSIKPEFHCGCAHNCDWSCQVFKYVCTEGCCPQCWRENDDIDEEILTLRQAAQNLDGGVVVCRFPRASSEQLYTQIRTKKEVRIHGEPQPIHLPVAGVLHARMLYKLLPKENVFVPAKQWQAAQARSETLEFVKLLQLAGAVDVRWETMNGRPATVTQSHGSATVVDETKTGCCQRNLTALGIVAGAVAQSEGDAPPLTAPLGFTGRVTARANRKAARATSSAELLAASPPRDLYHLERRPEWQGMLDMLLSFGVTAGATFTLEHDAHDSSLSRKLRALGSLGVDTGYNAVGRSRLYTYVTVVVADRGAEEALGAGTVHPMSALPDTWERTQALRLPALHVALNDIGADGEIAGNFAANTAAANAAGVPKDAIAQLALPPDYMHAALAVGRAAVTAAPAVAAPK